MARAARIGPDRISVNEIPRVLDASRFGVARFL
jgi:hypothetical protein